MADRLVRLPPEITDQRRSRLRILTLGGEYAPNAAWAISIAAAATGIGAVANDHHGSQQSAASHLSGSYDRMVAAIGPETAYHYLDPQFLEDDYESLCQGDVDPTFVIIANQPQSALAALPPRSMTNARILLLIVGTGAVYVESVRNVEVARARIASFAHLGTVPPGPKELAMLAAGAVLHDVTMGNPLSGDADYRPLAYYAPNCPRRVDVPPDLAQVHAAASTSLDGWASFAGKRVLLIGASGLGSPAGNLIASDDGVELTVIDRGRVKAANLNRAPAYTSQDIGMPKGPAFARQAELYNPNALFRGLHQEISVETDVPSDVAWDAIVCAPDNDPVRIQTAIAARRLQVPYVTGATSPRNGYAVVQLSGSGGSFPAGPCFECQTNTDAAPGEQSPPASCMVVEPSVCASNFIIASVAISEIRNCLGSIHRPRNIRFQGNRANGNYLARKATPAACPHSLAGDSIPVQE